MTNTMKLGMLSLAASAILVGCGSSSTSDSTTTNDTTTNLETGYFIDAPVEGLTYVTTSGEEGVTDQYGRFQYKHGDKVRFTIGKLDLGEATPDQEGLVTPETIAENDDDLKVQILRVLQALDSDNDPSNGITIPEDVIAALTTSLENNVSIEEVKDDEQILDLDPTLAEKLDEDYDGVIDVTDTEAETHYDTSISKWQEGHKPDEEEQNTQTQGNGKGNGKGQGGSNESGNTDGSHGNGEENGSHGDESQSTFDINQYPVTTNLTQELKDALAFMGNEERLAYDIYMTLYNYHEENGDEIKQFKNIATRSEITHVGIVQDLVKRYNLGAADVTNVETPVADNTITFEEMPTGKYDVPAIQELYDNLYEYGIQDTQKALEVGCMVEVTDVEDLDIRIQEAEDANATDILEGFKVLRQGSYNHYWAFDKGLKNMGVEAGCAVLGEEYAKTPEEFPSNN